MHDDSLISVEQLSDQLKKAWRNKEFSYGASLASRLEQEHPEDSRGLHLAAVVAFESGDPELALSRLSKAVKNGCQIAEVWNEHGRVLLHLSRLGLAAESFRTAISLDPTLGAAQFNLSLAQDRLGERTAAMKTLADCVAADIAPATARSLLIGWLREAGDDTAALALAIQVFDRDEGDLEITAALADLLKANPHVTTPELASFLPKLLSHKSIDPQDVASACWISLVRSMDIGPLLKATETNSSKFSELMVALEKNALALELIATTMPPFRLAEICLTGVRAELLLSGKSAEFPLLTKSLALQLALNGGAWPVSDAESDALNTNGKHAIHAAYPSTLVQKRRAARSPIQAQYEAYPYPTWQRLTVRPRRSFAQFSAAYRAHSAGSSCPEHPLILIAGCGTGRHALMIATTIPDAAVTAIDISETSLTYARDRASDMGVTNIDFRQLDLLQVASLGSRFDHIECAGVLHHMDNPKAGWRALRDVMALNGTMRIGLYSRHARRGLQKARNVLAPLGVSPGDDAALRRARALILAAPDSADFSVVWKVMDFYSMAGFRDLLFNAHEDLFDLPRISDYLDQLNLRFLGFDPLSAQVRANKAALFPDDPANTGALTIWNEYEKIYPDTFLEMYQFWCKRL